MRAAIKKFKSLKRHLRTQYGLTPEAYREKWGLPADYPMVAPNYAQKRSDFAKKIGLGKGKAEHDKRETEKKRDWERERGRLMRHKVSGPKKD